MQPQQQQPYLRPVEGNGSSGGEWGDLRSVIRNPAAALSNLTQRLGNQLQPG